VRIEINNDHYLTGGQWLQQFRPRVLIQASPSLFLNQLSLDSYFGQAIDFDNSREGTGASLTNSFTLRPGDHLELYANFNLSWLNESVTPGAPQSRLFTAQVERLRATWSFSARAFLRLIGQYVETTRDPSMYTFAVDAKDAEFDGSALLAYKLNWQTVAYVGYGDTRTLVDLTGQLAPSQKEVFVKLSYAWQH